MDIKERATDQAKDTHETHSHQSDTQINISGVEASGGPNLGRETSPPPEATTELFLASKTGEISHDDEQDDDTIILTPESVPSIVDDPDVPTLTRTDSIFLTTEYLESPSKLSETSTTSRTSSDKEYRTSKESINETSEDDDLRSRRKVPQWKQKKCQRNYGKKTLPTTSSKDGSSENSDSNRSEMSVMKLKRTEDGEEVPDDLLVGSDLSDTEGNRESSLRSLSSGSSKRMLVTGDELIDLSAPIESSTPKRRKETESDSEDLKTETSHRRWSPDEVHAVEKKLLSFIECGKVPGKSECIACIEASPEALKKRGWTAVKFYVKDRITAIQRKSKGRIYEKTR